jgi:hypothetical protein
MKQEDNGRPTLYINNCFFKIFRDKDEVTAEEVYTACEKQPDGNKFLQNRLTEWKRKGLVRPVYELRTYPYPFRKILKRIKLTFLGRSYFPRAAQQTIGILTADELLHIVADFKSQHPDIDVTFELRWRPTNPKLVIGPDQCLKS